MRFCCQKYVSPSENVYTSMKEVYLKSIFRMAAFVFCKYTEFLTVVVTVTGNIWVWSFSFNFRINTFYTCSIAFKSSENLPQSGIFFLFFRNSVSCLWVADERIILKLFFFWRIRALLFFLKLRAWRQHISFNAIQYSSAFLIQSWLNAAQLEIPQSSNMLHFSFCPLPWRY